MFGWFKEKIKEVTDDDLIDEYTRSILSTYISNNRTIHKANPEVPYAVVYESCQLAKSIVNDINKVKESK